MQQFNASVPPDSLPFAIDDSAAPTGAGHRNELLQPELPRIDSAAPARLRMLGRSRLVYAMMDTTFDMALLATALHSLLKDTGACCAADAAATACTCSLDARAGLVAASLTVAVLPV